MTRLKRTGNKNIADILALTPLQEGLLFHYLKDPESDYYFEQLRLRISGPLDTGVFERAWNTVVETNEMLRAVFRWEKLDNPVQMVLKKHALQWRYHDLSRPDARETEKQLEQIAANDREEKFDLREVPFRVTLCKLGESIFEVIISNHHILYDGWSNGIILKEFFNAYHDIAVGKEPVKPVKTGFKEFIAWLGNRDTEKEREYWRNYLDGLTVGTGIPVKKRKSEAAQEIETYCLEFSREMNEGLAMVQKRRVSAAALLYGAWGILLQGYCNSEDVVFGTTVAGRSAKVTGIEDIVGLFINTLPLRVQAREGEKIEELLYRVNHTLQPGEEVENTPLVEIDKCREPGSKDELFDSIVVIENYPLDYRLTRGMGPLSLQSYSLVESAHYDLTVVIKLFADVEITFSYDRGVFAREVVARLAGHFQRIMRELAANPGRETRQIEMLSPEEKRQLVEEFNNTNVDFPRDKTIHRLFEEQASKTPDHIAVVGAGPVETLCATSLQTLQTVYRQLNEQSDRLAGLLIEKGVLPGDVVAIMIERSLEMVIGILGILKAGGAYMPIDPEYPRERIDYMLKDCGVKILLRKEGCQKEIIVNCQLLIINCKLKNLPQASYHHSSFIVHHLNQLAYIIYTSGTTGRPKGVMVEHRSVVRLVKNTDYVEFREGDRILQTGALEFDASTFEIWGALLNGLILFLVKKEQVLSPVELRKAVEKHDISTMWLTSSLFNRLSEADIEIFAPPRNVLVGGEALSPVHINKLRARFARLNIINGYGPTENTAFSTTYRIEKEYNDTIPIGKPIANSTAYIVDRWNRIQPVGVVGELYVGGHGVARGYLNNVELTADKFKKSYRSYRSNRTYILYKTGDFARWLNDGNIEFIGRVDSQVKIRGFRIEPGEIERRLMEHKDIKEAVVIDRVVNNEKCLCAYIIVQEENNIDVTELRQYLSQIMPAYMIPSYFTVMERLPLTANGKIDRKALPEPQVKPSEQYTAYRDEIEESLAEIWSHSLGIEKEKIGIDDNFFQLGGHSLKAMQLIGRVHKYFDVNIPVTEIFAVPSIRGQANYIKSQRNAAAAGDFEPLEPVEERGYYELSPGQQRIYMIQQMDPRSTAFHISSAIELVGEVEPGKLREVFKKMILRHESLRTSFIQVEGKPVQRILEPTEVEFDIEYYDLATEDTEDTEGKNHHSSFMNTPNHFMRPFDLSRAPLLRVGLFKNHDGKSILLIDIHHIVADGTSVDILTAEFQAFRSGRELPFPLIQYKDFCQWQSRLSRREEMKNHEKYWLQRLKGQLPLLPMPTDYPRPEEQNLEGDYVYYSLEKELSLKVRQYLRETGATLYMLLLTVFNILLYRYTGQEDIIIGSPIAGRDHADLERVVGLLIGSLPMRNFPRECKTFSGFLEEIKRGTLQAYEHRWYPYEEILRKVNYTAHAGRNPISDISLIVQNTNTGNRGQRLSRSKSHEDLFLKTSKVDMTMIVEEDAGDIVLSLEYRTGLFKRESMERCLRHFVHLLENGIADSTAYLSFIEMTSIEEKPRFIGAVEKCYPLSHPQKRIYFTEKRYHGTPAATLGFVVRYEEILDMDLLETAINRVIEKNDSMRLRIVEFPFEKEPRQYVAPFERQSIDFIDFSSNGKDNEDFLRQWLDEKRTVPFEFLNRNLFYFVRLRFNKKETGYYLKTHHIISDGWSIYALLTRQIDLIYKELKAGRRVDEESCPSYLHYLVDERQYLNSSQAEKDKEFWRGLLLPLPPAVRLSTGESDIFNIKSGISKFILPPSVMGDIHKYIQSPGTKTSIYKLLFSVFSIFISTAADLCDFVIGSAGHNRIDERRKQTVGMFVGTIPIRVQVNENQDFHSFVATNGHLINTIVKNHGQYPFDVLAVRIGEEVGADLNYLLDISFIDLGYPGNERFKLDTYFCGYDQNQVTVYLFHETGRDILELEWDYRESLFTPSEISRMHNCMMVILEDALRHPGKKIKELELLSPGEKRQILEDFNDNESPSPFPLDLPLHELFSRQVERVSGRAAVVGAETNHHVSYRQVDEQSGNLAFLLHERGVVPGDIVAVLMEPSHERIIVLLGILKAGAAYLPIDPQCPQERIDYMLKDSAAKILLTAAECVFDFHHSSFIIHHSNQLAYLIYTSGSTGRPKGVGVAHRNVIAYLTAFDKEFQLKETDTVIQQASYTFDAFVEEMYPILVKGGKLAVPSRATVKDIHLLVEFIARYSVAMITCSPLLLDQLNSLDSHESLRGIHTFISGGDVLRGRFIDKLLKVGKVYNTYGPTESTVCVTYYRCPEGIEGNVPIGKPIANYKVYILDRNRRQVPPGIPGELCVAGPGVAMGYLNRPELTAEIFIKTRSYRTYKTYIFYRTGDLCKWLSDGNIEFLGRIDHQVKIRGFRIESGEIEARLLENPSIQKAVVIAREDKCGDRNLIAYIVPRVDISVSAGMLREYLARALPDYMLPSHFVFLAQIPLTPGGKVDRRALPEPGTKEEPDNYTAPRNEIEKKLAAIWSEVLLIPRVGIDDNFFQSGGHSLKASIMTARVLKILNIKAPLAEIFRRPTIRELTRYILAEEKSHYAVVTAAEEKEYYPLSPGQKRLYLVYRMDVENTGYNITTALELEGDIHIEKLQATFRELVRRHESFRTSFFMTAEEAVQRIHPPAEVEFKIEYNDLATGTTGIHHFIRPFDLSHAPLLRVGLERGDEKKHLLLVDMHHIIADGVSMAILVKEFTALYAGAHLPALKLRYRDYAEWRNRGKNDVDKRQENYWLMQFETGDIPVLSLPLDYPRPTIQGFAGADLRFEINEEDAGALRSLAVKEDITLFMLLFALFNVLLAKLSGQQDIIVGSPTAGRNHADLQDIIGMFVNTLALRNFPIAEKPFNQFLREVKERTLTAFENQEYPFENLVERLQVKRDTGRNPLFDVAFVYQNMDVPEVHIPGLKIKSQDPEKETSIFDITWQTFESGPKLLFIIEFSAQLFKPETIQRFTGYWLNLVKQACLNPAARAMDMDILSPEERNLLLFVFNETQYEYPEHKTIHELFVEQVDKTPDHIAVVGAGSQTCPITLSYNELNEQSDRLAGLLIEKGVPADSIVGIMIERSIDMIIGILGILKSGGAYLPIDPSYPRDRIDYMLADSNAKILLGAEECRKEIIINCQLLIVNCKLKNLPQAPYHHSSFIIHHLNQLAYIIYTSGTTGRPKGVMVEHRSVVRLVKNTDYVEFREGDRILQTGALEFDASTFEIWGALLNGLILFLVKKEQVLSPVELRKAVEKHDISTMWLTSSLFNRLSEADIEIFAPLRNVLVGGEALSPVHINKLRARFTKLNIINGYGPTENTTFSTTYRINREFKDNIPIGRPIANSTAYIVDPWNRLQPLGVAGELHVGGHGVARGYLNNVELTADKFNRSYRSNRTYVFYKTGDLCRWLPRGNIEFLGRIDGQVKLRGFRIELSEIESRLTAHDDIKEAVVVLKEKNRQPYLCAYFVPVREAAVPGLREYLSGTLPAYMIPSYFVPMDGIPLTPNGKVDRKALPDPEIKSGDDYVAPSGETEWKLAEIWSEVLGIDKNIIGSHDDFFQLGGHSLKAAILTAKIQKAFNVKIKLTDIFVKPTLKSLSQYLKGAEEETFRAINTAEKKEYYPITPAQKRLFVLQQMDLSSVSYNIPAVFIMEGELYSQTMTDICRKMIRRHESLRTSFMMVNDEPVQRVHENVAFEIEYKNIATDEHGQTRTLIKDFIRPFDLSCAPLLRMGLMKVGEDRQFLMLDMHHITADGTSLGVFVKEFMAFHSGIELPGLKIQYKDFALWQNGFQETGKMQKQENYWMSQFEGEIPSLNLPVDFLRPAVRSFEGSTLKFEVGEGDTAALRALAMKEGITLYMLIASVFNVLLSRLTGQEDIIVGMPTAGRRHADLQQLIGMFVNTLALRNFPSANKTFIEFLGEVKQNTLEAFENQEYPFEDLVEKVVVNRDPGRNPLFDVMFVLQNLENVKIQIPGLLLKPYEYQSGISKFDLTLIGVEDGNRVVFTIEYCAALFKEETIKRLIGYFNKLLSSMLEEPGQKIFKIEIIPEEERRRILNDFNNTAHEYPESKTIYGLVEEQVERAPDHIALVGAAAVETLRATSLQITYRQLNDQSDRLAGLLIEKGVLADSIVGIMMERSIEMIIAILGILKSGGAYLPIDPSYPQERIDYMLKDSGTRLLVGASHKEGEEVRRWEGEKVLLHEILKSSYPLTLLPSYLLNPSNLAYVIYTSGSTGRPKGVLVRHEGFVNLIYCHRKIFGEGPGISVSQVANPGFDAMASEVWPCLSSGATLYIVDEETRLDPARMKQWLIEKRIGISFQPTVIAEQLLDEDWPEEGVALRVLRTAGDKLTRYPARKYPFKLYNLYGPTEDTVWTTWTEVPVKPGADGAPSIGKPIGNHHVYIVGMHLELQPIGVPGELCISGVGLARGYLNNPELTAERFLRNYRSYKSYRTYICYKTGDLARWLPASPPSGGASGGGIEFLGRIDGQVKLRGFRIELAEIESRLAAHVDIKEAVVVLKEKNRQPYLCAYFVPVREVVVSELREYLAGMLPAYMIPSYFVPMDRIPLTPNGKLDRRALPEPVIKTDESFAAPGNFVEEKLVEIWQEVLDVEGIGIHDNFFEVGGDSIKGVQIVSRLQKYGLKMEVADLFLHPTIKGASASIKKLERIADQGTVTGLVELTPIQQWFFLNDFTHSRHFNQAVMVYREAGFDEAVVRRVFEKIVEHHDALRMVYEKSREGREEHEDIKIIQRNRGLEGRLFGLEVFDFQNEPEGEREIEKEAERIQVSIDLETGPLVHLGLFRTGKGDHMLMVIHHLVIDGVSWRILLEDFAAGYRRALKGESVKFQAKTDSYKEWARGLMKYAGSERLLKELEYWKRIETGDSLPKDMEISEEEKREKNFATIELKLNEEETVKLLRRVHRAYGTEINDILLAGLVSALKERWGIEKVLINLEGHGREELLENINISRTVGWFTSRYPVLLKAYRSREMDYLVKEVKETLRRVPRRGIGYGILKYLAAAGKKGAFPSTLEAEIDFNYLGEFASGLNNDIFQVSELKTGHSLSPEMEKKTVLDISGLTVEGQLTLFVSYNRRQYRRETIEGLAAVFRSKLSALIEYCAAREVKTLTPSDLTYSEFTVDELDALVGRRGELEDIYELAPMQAGMLFHALKENTAGAYFQQTVFSLRGDIDVVLLQTAYRQLIDRYDVMRTVFYYENVHRPVQIVLKHCPVHIDFLDLRGEAGAEEMQLYLQQFYGKDRERGFDLADGPLTRLALLKTGNDSYRLVWSFHHILMDGWCLSIIFKELLYIYRCLKKGASVELEPIAQYRNYIKWLRRQEIGAGEKYWKNYLDGYEQQVELPRSREMMPGEGYRLEEYTFCLDDALWERLKALSADWRATVNTVMQAAWGILLQRYNNTEDVVFGAVTAGRPSGIKGIEGMVGLFINTLPVRVKTIGKETFVQLLREVQADAVSSRAYEYISLADIQAGSLLKEALINHIMVFENYPLDKEIKNSLNPLEYGFTVVGLWAFEQTNYDFNITISPQNNLVIKFSYNVSVYDRELVERSGVYLNNILMQVVEKLGLEVGAIEIITDEEKRRILDDFNDTEAAYPDHKTIHQLFEEQVEKTPDHIALVGNIELVGLVRLVSLTYRQLNGQSDRLAGLLIEKGVLVDSIVGIMIERSVEMIIGIYGILKAGGAYLPIDPSYPRERIDYMLVDSNARILLAMEECRKEIIVNCQLLIVNCKLLIGCPRRGLHHSSFIIHRSNHLSYLIYTSGSTGKPKGVMIEHRSVVNILSDLFTRYPFVETDCFLLKTAYTFDVSVSELFGWFWGGGRLALLAAGAEKDPEQITRAIERFRVTHIDFVPSMFGVFLEVLKIRGIKEIVSLKYIFMAGEELSPSLVGHFRDFDSKILLENLYGPTEGTVYASGYSLVHWKGGVNVPIGKPLRNVGLYIVDNYYRLQPIGAAGELCIGGDGLARGYLNNPELTEEKFINKSFFRESRGAVFSKKAPLVYKTGDLARWLDDGNIEFLGRMDHQVKIRGFRIETGEIENVLLKHNDVRTAVVLAKEEGYLCAYFTSEREIPASLLREFAAKALPEYMVPSYFIQMEKLPLTPNGKLDRKVLPEPGQITDSEYTAPTGKVEEKLAEIWAEVLGIPRETISAGANFFHLGGHSLRATVLMSKIHKYLDIKIPLEKIFKVPTIKGLADYINGAEEETFTPIPPAEEKEYYVLSASQDRFYMFQQLDRGATIYNMPEVVLLEGKFERKRLEDVFFKLIGRHESFRTSFIKVGGEVVQRIRRDVGFEIEYYNAATDEHGQTRTFLKEFIRPFDLSKAPLLRVGLIKEKEEEHILLVDTHHIISDGASQTLLMKEFMDIFRGEEPTLTSGLRTRYKDYAEWQNSADMRKVLKTQEEYWLKEFAGDIPVANLPMDFDRPDVMHFEGSMLEFEIEAGETGELKRMTGEEGVSLFGLLLAIVNVFLAKITRREDIRIGTQVAGRGHPDLQGIIGVFLNSLALRNYPGQEKTFKAFLNQVMERTLQAFENQEYRFEDLVEKVLGKREINRNPLFDVMLVWQNFERQEIQVPGLTLKPYPHEHKSRALTDLSLYGWEMDEKLVFTFEYSTEIFKKETVERFITYFKEIVSTIIANKEIKIGDIKISHDLGMAEPVLFRDSDDGFGF